MISVDHSQVREELYTAYSYGLLDFCDLKDLLKAENDCQDDDLDIDEEECREHGGSHEFTNKRSGGVWACDCGAESDGL